MRLLCNNYSLEFNINLTNKYITVRNISLFMEGKSLDEFIDNKIRPFFSKVIRWTLAALGAAFAIVFGNVISSAWEHQSEQEIREQAIAALADAALEMQKELPMQLDEFTTLEKANVNELDITYSNRLALDASSLTQEQLSEIESNIRSDVELRACYNTDMQPLFDAGVTYYYEYYDEYNSPVAYVSLDKSSCEHSSTY